MKKAKIIAAVAIVLSAARSPDGLQPEKCDVYAVY